MTKNEKLEQNVLESIKSQLFDLSDVQREFINFTIPYELYNKYHNRKLIDLNRILREKKYNWFDRIVLLDLRKEYIKNRK